MGHYKKGVSCSYSEYTIGMNIAIAFASLSGNTLTVATYLQSYLIKQKHEITLYDLLKTSANKLKQHDLVFIGSSTYGDGDLNPIAEMFLSAAHFENHTCDHTKFAILSLGDSSYLQFAAGGQILSDSLTEMGAKVILPILTIDGTPDENTFSKVREWADKIIDLAI